MARTVSAVVPFLGPLLSAQADLQSWLAKMVDLTDPTPGGGGRTP